MLFSNSTGPKIAVLKLHGNCTCIVVLDFKIKNPFKIVVRQSIWRLSRWIRLFSGIVFTVEDFIWAPRNMNSKNKVRRRKARNYLSQEDNFRKIFSGRITSKTTILINENSKNRNLVQVRSGPAQFGPTLSGPAQSSPAQSGPVTIRHLNNWALKQSGP